MCEQRCIGCQCLCNLDKLRTYQGTFQGSIAYPDCIIDPENTGCGVPQFLFVQYFRLGDTDNLHVHLQEQI